jgi:hypothetical protein
MAAPKEPRSCQVSFKRPADKRRKKGKRKKQKCCKPFSCACVVFSLAFLTFVVGHWLANYHTYFQSHLPLATSKIDAVREKANALRKVIPPPPPLLHHSAIAMHPPPPGILEGLTNRMLSIGGELAPPVPPALAEIAPSVGAATVEPAAPTEGWARLGETGKIEDGPAVTPMWFDMPAPDWTSAFPIGNGRMGAIVSWQPWQEIIPLSEDTLWTPFAHANYKQKPPPGQALKDRLKYEKSSGRMPKAEAINTMRKKMWEGDVEGAEKLCGKLSAGQVSSFSFLGNIAIDVTPLSPSSKPAGAEAAVQLDPVVSRYERRLQFDQGTTQVRFTSRAGAKDKEGGEQGAESTVWHAREAFASATDQLVVMRLKCGAVAEAAEEANDHGGCMAVELGVNRPQMQPYATITTESLQLEEPLRRLLEQELVGAAGAKPGNDILAAAKGTAGALLKGVELHMVCVHSLDDAPGVGYAACAAAVPANERTRGGGASGKGKEEGKGAVLPKVEIIQPTGKGGARLKVSHLGSRSSPELSSELVVLLAGATSFHKERQEQPAQSPVELCQARLARGAAEIIMGSRGSAGGSAGASAGAGVGTGGGGYGYAAMRRRHVEEHQHLFSTNTLQLHPHLSPTSTAANASDASITSGLLPPTNALHDLASSRIDRKGVGAYVPELILLEQLYNMGRYLLIGSSRPGTQPMNLQGIWGNALEAQWHGDYHININMQMQYWAAGATNLRRTVEPMLQFVHEIARSGELTADVYYPNGKAQGAVDGGQDGRRSGHGWVAHGFTDIWMGTPPYDEMQWALCPTCGAWVALALWDEFEYGWPWRTPVRRAGVDGEGAAQRGETKATLAAQCAAVRQGDGASSAADDPGLGGACTALAYLHFVAFPVLRSSALFFLDYLHVSSTPPGGAGATPTQSEPPLLFTMPSTSPENSYRCCGGRSLFLAAGPAFDTAVLVALFEAVLRAGGLLIKWGVFSEQKAGEGGSKSKEWAKVTVASLANDDQWMTHLTPHYAHFAAKGGYYQHHRYGTTKGSWESENEQEWSREGMDKLLERIRSTLERLPNGGRPYLNDKGDTSGADGSGAGAGADGDNAVLMEYMGTAMGIDKRLAQRLLKSDSSASTVEVMAKAEAALPKVALTSLPFDKGQTKPTGTKPTGIDTHIPDPGHRHWSGVWPLYPGRVIHPYSFGSTREQAVAQAARNTINKKLAGADGPGGGHTGWSAVWAACLLLRLHDGDRALEYIRRVLGSFTTYGLLGLHPPLKPLSPSARRPSCYTCYTRADCPDSNTGNSQHHPKAMTTMQGDFFQIDANLGLLAAMAEMLLQWRAVPASAVQAAKASSGANGLFEGGGADDGETSRGAHEMLLLHLLPALPQSWTRPAADASAGAGAASAAGAGDDHRVESASEGRVVGLRAAGGVVVSMWWARGVVQEAWLEAEATRASAGAGGTVSFVVTAGDASSPGAVLEVFAVEGQAKKGALHGTEVIVASVEEKEGSNTVPPKAAGIGVKGVFVMLRQGERVRLRCSCSGTQMHSCIACGKTEGEQSGGKVGAGGGAQGRAVVQEVQADWLDESSIEWATRAGRFSTLRPLQTYMHPTACKPDLGRGRLIKERPRGGQKRRREVEATREIVTAVVDDRVHKGYIFLQNTDYDFNKKAHPQLVTVTARGGASKSCDSVGTASPAGSDIRKQQPPGGGRTAGVGYYAEACGAEKECSAFNSNGWLKRVQALSACPVEAGGTMSAAVLQAGLVTGQSFAAGVQKDGKLRAGGVYLHHSVLPKLLLEGEGGAAGTVDEFVLIPFHDYVGTGSDIRKVDADGGGDSTQAHDAKWLRRAAQECAKQYDCGGFNSNGWLKRVPALPLLSGDLGVSAEPALGNEGGLWVRTTQKKQQAATKKQQAATK